MSQFILRNQAKNRLWLKNYALAKRTIWILNCLCWKQKGRGTVQTFVWQPTPTPKNKSFQPSHSASWLDLMFISLLKKLMCWNVFVEFGHHALDVFVGWQYIWTRFPCLFCSHKTPTQTIQKVSRDFHVEKITVKTHTKIIYEFIYHQLHIKTSDI